MSAAEFQRLGHRLVDQIAELLASLPDGPVTHAETPAEVRAAVQTTTALPEEGSDADALLEQAVALLRHHSLFNGHPKFLGYITSSPAPIGILGDMLAAAINPNLGGWTLSPSATEIEIQTVRWIAEFIGYPVDCGGLLVSGGNMANLIGLIAARAARAGWDVRNAGLRGEVPLAVYASAETHTWVQKAADLSGIGTSAIRWIAVDRRQRIDVSALESRIESDLRAGVRPFMVIGTAGSVSTGAVDPLSALSDICRRFDLWFHVDGAYGALAARVPGAPDDLEALRLADSVAVDPHKWLYAPLEAGCALVRRADQLRNAFSYRPPYYHLEDEGVNYVDYGPQNSRGFRALKVWLALRQAGRSGYTRMIAEDMALSRRLFDALQQRQEFDALTNNLSITTFRFVPEDLRRSIGTQETEEYLNHLNRDLLTRIEQSGEVFLSNAIVDGKFALRACIVNFHTSGEDIDAIPGIVARLGREVDTALRVARSG